MNRAWLMVKRHVEARHDAFRAGLRAAGYQVIEQYPTGRARPGDVLVTWNRKREVEWIADKFEREGGTVLVAENGYIGRDEHGHQLYAIAIHGHNGSGERLIELDPARWLRLGIGIAPWRSAGGHILVCPNRFIAPNWFRMPDDWAAETMRKLSRSTGREVRLRPHPGHWKRLPVHPDVTLARDLANAWAMVIWASSAGVRALIAGVPVIVTAPWWICKGAAGTSLSEIESPPMPERQGALDELASSQFTIEEIAGGVPFLAARARIERKAA